MPSWPWLLVGWVAVTTGWALLMAGRSYRALEDDDEMTYSMTSDFRRDGSRPDGIPNVEDSGVWGRRAPEPEPPTLRDAMVAVLAEGERRARCGACGSPATTIEAVQWQKYGPLAHQTFVVVLETCPNCEVQQSYRLDAPAWVALAAFRAWDEFDQATETLDVAVATAEMLDKATDLDSVDQDLRELDE